MPGDARAAQGRKRRWKGKNGGRRGKTALEGEKRQDGKRRREREKRCREGRSGVRRAAQAAFWGKALFRGRMGDARAGKAGARQQAEGPGSRPYRKRRKAQHGGCAGVGKAAPRRVAAGAEKEKPRVCGV